MDFRLILTTFSICIGVLFWVYYNRQMYIDYERHPQLIDPKTGAKLQPNQLLKLSKIMNITSSYINSTNAHQRLYDLEYQLNFENPFLIDQSYSNPHDLMISGWPVANHTLCAAHLNWILAKLDANQNFTYLTGELGFELTSLIDTFGKPQSSAFSGSVHWLGSYRRCSGLSLDKGRIKTRYCIGKMRPQSWPTDETIYPKTRIRFGMCLPESCDTGSFEEQRLSIERLAKYDLSEFYKSDLQLDSMFCLPDERSPLRQIPASGKVYIYIVGGWFALVLIASIFHEIIIQRRRVLMKNHINEKTQTSSSNWLTEVEDNWKQFLEALSLRCNIMSFRCNNFNIRYNQGERVRVNLASVNFFKVFMTTVIVISHSAYLNLNFTRTLNNRIDLATSWAGLLSLSAPRCVDTFFMFFGVFTTYTMMRKLNSKQLGNVMLWMAINIGTMLRLAPLWALVYWYSRLISPYTGSGPWWDYGVDKLSMKGYCTSESLWKSLPYFGTIGLPSFPTCLLPGWFLVSYSQISLLLPPLTYVIYKLPNHKSRFCLTGFLLVASAISVSLRLYNQTSIPEEAFSMYGTFLVSLMENFESTGHMTTLSRLGSVALGCLIGYFLRMYEIGTIQRWPKFITSKWTLVFTFIAHIFILLMPILAQLNPRKVSLEEFIVGDLVLSIVWPLLNSVFVIEFTSESNHRTLARFFGHTFWQVTNRLGLLVYLIHWEVLFVAMTGFEHAPSYGFISDILKLASFGLLISTILALVLYLLVEAPFANILMIVYRNKMQATRMAKDVDTYADTKEISVNVLKEIE